MKRVIFILLLAGIFLPVQFVRAQGAVTPPAAVQAATSPGATTSASPGMWSAPGPIDPVPDSPVAARRILLPLYFIFGGSRSATVPDSSAFAAGTAGESGTTLALKAASRFGTLCAAQRLWATSPAGAVLLLMTVDSSMALHVWTVE